MKIWFGSLLRCVEVTDVGFGNPSLRLKPIFESLFGSD